MSEALRSPKLRPWHLDRVAIVCVRQSTPQQVLDHKESTARQYALADRAVALRWPRDRVVTIDDDLGKSGQPIAGRPGFRRLLAEVALDHVGLILGLEMSRLARCCSEPLCQGLSNARTLEELVANQLPAAVQPAVLEARLAAVAGVERQRAELTRQWQLRRERAALAADRAARQYQACEPENRLAARERERRWEEAPKQKQQLDDEYDRFLRSAPAELSDTALSASRAPAADLPAVWSAATTTPADRRRIARRLLERVVVTVDRASERVEVTLHWAGGAVRSHTTTRPVARYSRQSDYQRLVVRLRALCTGRRTSADIAQQLSAEGFRPPQRAQQFTAAMARRLTVHRGWFGRQRHGSAIGLATDAYRPMGLARRLGISRDAVRRWLRAGWLNVRRDADGHQVIWADAGELRRLRALHDLPRTWANKKRLAKLKQPKRRPAR
jgi:DNA invertase Pin-like site-specific DNA recombinase